MAGVNLYIWNDVPEGLTANWHDGGGVLAVAPTVERARELVLAAAAGKPERLLESLAAEPDETWALEGDYAERVVIFPDAGCC